MVFYPRPIRRVDRARHWLALSLAVLAVFLFRMGCRRIQEGQTLAAGQIPVPIAETVESGPPPGSYDWSIPERYRGKFVTARLTGFPDKLLALTIDDGPAPEMTARMLDILKEHKARATFFVLGCQVERYPDLVKRIAREGHAIGNHSYSHKPRATGQAAEDQVMKTERLVQDLTGQKPTCFRPPNGVTDGPVAKLAASKGYCVVTWTQSSSDTTSGITPSVIERNIAHTPDPGAIILCHDGGPHHEATAEALPEVLRELTDAGFRFVTLPVLLRAWDDWLSSQGK